MIITEYKNIIEKVYKDLLKKDLSGEIASYIPALEEVDEGKFGVSISTLLGDHFSIGDAEERFSIQSISKVFSLSMAIDILGDKLWKRIGVEPSGNPFNSLVQLEYEQGIPRNPFINAGAIVLADILITKYKNPFEHYLDMIIELCGSANLSYDQSIFESEKEFGDRNRALAYFVKSYNNLENPVEEVLDLYFKQCSILMNCAELSQAFLYLANHGLNPRNQRRILSSSQTKRLNAVMLTCGFYDESGDFAYYVGLPGKSGVGGGIAAIFPQHYSISVWSPPLDKKGNSELGMQFLERFTTETHESIF
jgi:glutaminase